MLYDIQLISVFYIADIDADSLSSFDRRINIWTFSLVNKKRIDIEWFVLLKGIYEEEIQIHIHICAYLLFKIRQYYYNSMKYILDKLFYRKNELF